MISPEQEALILRLFHAEKWRVGTIAHQVGVHPDVVRRVLTEAGAIKPQEQRPSRIDPYIPFIVETFKKYPKVTAARLYDMVKERGYTGNADHFRHLVAPLRPPRHVEGYLRLRTLPGEQAQADWGHFGKITFGKFQRTLWAFVMVLSFSRAIFLRFYPGASSFFFILGHVEAFNFWGGAVRTVLYDNLKSVVLERRGDAIRFHPTILALAAHYHLEPRPVAVARGNEKGRVERSIRFIRDSFFAARKWKDLADLNRQADAWCRERAADRPWPEDRTLQVKDAFEQEKTKLLPLPGDPFPAEERLEVSVGKTPYVRFDRNDYSVPHTFAGKTLVVSATLAPEVLRQGPGDRRHEAYRGVGRGEEEGAQGTRRRPAPPRSPRQRGIPRPAGRPGGEARFLRDPALAAPRDLRGRGTRLGHRRVPPEGRTPSPRRGPRPGEAPPGSRSGSHPPPGATR
jgi:transposase